MPPFSLQPPVIVHHMAALDRQPAPPNSLAAVQACLQAGARCIEIDVTALADQDYLLVHDPELEVETSGQGTVGQQTAAQVRGLSIKHKDALTPYPVALLSEVVAAIRDTPGDARLQIDYKNVIPFPDDEPLRRIAHLIEPLGERVILSSGADWQLRRLRKLAPWLALGFDIMWYIDWQPEGTPRDPRQFPKIRGEYGYWDDHILASQRHWSIPEYLQDRCESLVHLVPGVSAFYLEHTLITQSLKDGFNWAAALHAYGILLDSWTMDATNPIAVQAAPLLLASGVDLFTTNTPLALTKLLNLS